MAARHHKVVVIGAGVSGLVTLKTLKQLGIECVIYEANSYHGGLWHFHPDNYGVAEFTYINVCRYNYAFSDFPFPEGPDFAHNTAIAKYLDDYVEHFSLADNIQYNTRVSKVVKSSGKVIGILAAVRGVAHHRDRRSGRVWAGEITRARSAQGAYYTTVPRLLLDDDPITEGLPDNRVGTFRNFFRMTANEFSFILDAIEGDISKAVTTLQPISAEERLMVTLRYLATGQSLTSLHYEWNISVASLSAYIMEVCQAINNNLSAQWLQTPNTEVEWREIASGFAKWNYPNCIGAIDGKHIAMNKPHHAGSQFHNYKGFESLVLMAVCDSNYRFTYIDLGAEGRNSDGGVFRQCSLYRCLDDNSIHIPEPVIPPLGQQELPFVLVGDEAFPLLTNLMRPYSKPKNGHLPEDQDTHNTRLSRARRLIENAFGILAGTWRILLRRIDLQPDKVRTLTLTTCILHNMLRSNRTPPTGAVLDRINITVEEGFGDFNIPVGRGENIAMRVRDRFKSYVNSHPILYT